MLSFIGSVVVHNRQEWECGNQFCAEHKCGRGEKAALHGACEPPEDLKHNKPVITLSDSLCMLHTHGFNRISFLLLA